MDEELDLRAFSLTIARHWRLIAITTVIAVVVGVLAVLLWPPEYQATATVAVTKPRYVLDFDERLRSLAATNSGNLPLGVIATNAYTLLATNEELKGRVLKELGWSISLEDLQKSMSIKADSGVIQFTGKGSNPERASLIANAWARLYAEQLNALFSSTAPNITALEGEAGYSLSALLQTEQALADFLARSQIASLEKQLEAASTALADRLALGDRLGMLAADARALQSRLKSLQTTAPSAANQFLTLIMEAQAVSPRFETPLSLQFNVDSSALPSMSSSELDAYLEAFAKGLEQRRQETSAESLSIPAQISIIQKELELQRNEYDRLLLSRDVTRDTHESIARKLEEQRLQAALEEPEVKVIGQAGLPSDPSWPKPFLMIALALAGGLIVGLIAALIAESVRPRQA